MASRVSFERMTRNSQLSFGRAVSVLGLLFVAQLAHAGEMCFSSLGLAAPALQPASQDRCLDTRAKPDACVVSAQRIDVGVAAPASSSPEPLPAVGEAEHAARMFRTVAEPRLPHGLAHVSSSPVYLLFRRYLS